MPCSPNYILENKTLHNYHCVNFKIACKQACLHIAVLKGNLVLKTSIM
jgi:hypothetical protein